MERERLRRERRGRGEVDEDEDDGGEDDEAEDSDEEEHEEDDEEEEAARRQRRLDRQQLRRDRREAAEARRQQRAAAAAAVDESNVFLSTLSLRSDDSDDEVVDQHAEGSVPEGGGSAAAVQGRTKVDDPMAEAGQPLAKGGSSEGAFELPLRTVFYGVEQEEWEDRIEWCEVDPKEDGRQLQLAEGEAQKRCIAALKGDSTASLSAPPSSQLSFSAFSLPSPSLSPSSRPSVRLTWLQSAPPSSIAHLHTLLSRQRLQRLAALYPNPSPSASFPSWILLPRSPQQGPPHPSLHPPPYLTHRPNDSLLRPDWEAAIIWDETDLLTKASLFRHHFALLLDQNDPSLLLPPAKLLNHLTPVASSTSPHDQYSRYNVSMDTSYHSPDTSLSSYHVLKILHATFASNLDHSIYRTILTKAELEQFHRPVLSFPRGEESLPLKPVDPAISLQVEDRDARYVPAVLEELSATDSDILLCEYLERYPPLLINVGMCSQVITYYRKKDDKDQFQPEVVDGDVVVLGRKDPSPFLGEVKEGVTVTALTNNLFIAPMARHAPPANTFLLIRSEGSWSIRPLPSCYLVGQQEPKQSVPYPNRRHALDLLQKQIEVFIYKRLREGRKRFAMEELGEHFGSSLVNEVLAKKVLKEVATFHRQSNDWVLDSLDRLPSEEKLQLLCTPEDVCVYESMLAADHRLKDEVGVRHVTNSKQIADLIDGLAEGDVKRAAEYILKHVLLMPWTLTKGFLAAKEGKGTLALHGRGNPFADGSGVSYINEKVTAKKMAEEFPELAEPKKKTGTNADLRKLTMEEMATALIKLGMGEDQVTGMLRWDRVRAIAKLSREAVVEGRYPNLSRFARQAKPTNAGVIEEQKKQIQLIFERQLAMLAKPGAPDYSKEVVDDPGAVKEKGGAAAMRMKAKAQQRGKSDFLLKKKKEREEEEEYKEFLAQRERNLRETQATTSKAKPTPASPAVAAGSSGASTSVPVAPTSSSPSSTAVKRKKKVLMTKLQHVIKITNKDGTQTVETRLYDDIDLLKAFLIDCKDLSRDKGKNLRQRLQLDSMHMQVGGGAGEKKGAGLKDEDDDEEEKAPKGEAKVELIQPPPGRVKIRTLEGIRARMRRLRGGGNGGVRPAGGLKKKRTKRGEIDDMFDLDEEDWKGGGGFNFPSPSAAEASPLITSTSSGTLKLSRRQLQQTPQDSYIRPTARKRKPEEALSIIPKKVLSRRRGDPRVYLSQALQEIIDEVFVLPYAAAFREPVSEKEAPDYEDIINSPMDLTTIRHQASKNIYNSREEFLTDVQLIVANCELYNGPDSALSTAARAVAEEVEALVTDRRQLLDEAEARIAHHRLLKALSDCEAMLRTLPGWKTFEHTPTWPEYVAKVPAPLSLDVLRERVDKGEYDTAGEFLWDVRQMHLNSIIYNGTEHVVTLQAHRMVIEATETLAKTYPPEHLQPSDALVQRKKTEAEAAAAQALEKATGGARGTPSIKYQPSSRATPAFSGPLTTPRVEMRDSPAPSPQLSPKLPMPSPLSTSGPASPALRGVASPARVDTPGAGTPAVSMTPFLVPSSSAASPSFPSSSSPSSSVPRPLLPPALAASSTSAFLPTTSAVAQGGVDGGSHVGAGGMSMHDEHDDAVLTALGSMIDEQGGGELMGGMPDADGMYWTGEQGMDETMGLTGEEKKDAEADDGWA